MTEKEKQVELLKNCKSEQEVREFIKKNKIELSEEDLDLVTGGCGDILEVVKNLLVKIFGQNSNDGFYGPSEIKDTTNDTFYGPSEIKDGQMPSDQ